MLFRIIFVVLFAGLHVQGYPYVDSRAPDLENVNRNYQQFVDNFGRATNDASEAVGNGVKTIAGVGQGFLETVKQFGSGAENVNNDVQKVFHKIGDAGKHSAEAAKKGFYNVINFGKSAEKEGENQANNINEEIGHVVRDGSDAVKESTNTFINMGKGMLKSGEKFNEKVEDVNDGLQGIIDKLGDAAKHTTKALQQGFFAVLGLGQDAKKQEHPDTAENIKKPQGVVEVIGDVTKKTTDGIKNGLSTLFNFGNGLFKFGDKKDDSLPNLVERVDVRNGDGGEDSFDDFKRNLNNEINSYKYSTSEPKSIKSRFKVWREIAGDTKDTIEDTINAIKKSMSSTLAASGKIVQVGVDLQKAQLTIESTFPRMGLRFVNLLFFRGDKKN